MVPPDGVFKIELTVPKVDLTQISDAIQGAVQSVDTAAIRDTISDAVQNVVQHVDTVAVREQLLSNPAVLTGVAGLAIVSAYVASKDQNEGWETNGVNRSRKHLERSGGWWRTCFSLLLATSF